MLIKKIEFILFFLFTNLTLLSVSFNKTNYSIIILLPLALLLALKSKLVFWRNFSFLLIFWFISILLYSYLIDLVYLKVAVFAFMIFLIASQFFSNSRINAAVYSRTLLKFFAVGSFLMFLICLVQLFYNLGPNREDKILGIICFFLLIYFLNINSGATYYPSLLLFIFWILSPDKFGIPEIFALVWSIFLVLRFRIFHFYFMLVSIGIFLVFFSFFLFSPEEGLQNSFWSNFDSMISHRILHILESVNIGNLNVDPHSYIGMIMTLILEDNFLGWIILSMFILLSINLIYSGYHLTCGFFLLMVLSGHHFTTGYYGLLFIFITFIFDEKKLLDKKYFFKRVKNEL